MTRQRRRSSTDKFDLITTLSRIALECGLSSRTQGRSLSIDAPLGTINVDVFAEEGGLLYLYCRTTSWDLPGERTDANDILSVLLAAYLRCQDTNYSATLWDVDHPVDVPATEVYARYLTLDQPNGSVIRDDSQSLEEFATLLRNIKSFGHLLPLLFTWDHGSEKGFSWDDAPTQEWAARVAAALEETIDAKVQYNRRMGPDWLYYRSVRRHITVFSSARAVAGIEKVFAVKTGLGTALPGITRRFYISSRIRSAVSLRAERTARRILTALNDAPLKGLTVIPLENHVLFAGGNHGLIIERESGIPAFRTEMARVRERHQREAAVLFRPSRYDWCDRIGDDRFELLVRDLLSREPGIQRVRRVGLSRDPDGRKDLIADWLTPPPPGSPVREGSAPFVIRKVVVQVKASSRSINKSKVPDIRDTIEDHQCSGFFLAVSSQLTSDLTDHLDRMRTEGQYFVDWWNRTEIEDRLTAHPDVAQRYGDVVRRVDP